MSVKLESGKFNFKSSLARYRRNLLCTYRVCYVKHFEILLAV